MASRLEVRGAATLARTMHRAGDDLADLTAANKAAGEQVATGARGRAPVLTGRLRASIRATGAPAAATITAGVRWAAVPEYGSPRKHITARGYLRGALAATDVTGVYTDAANDALQHVKGI